MKRDEGGSGGRFAMVPEAVARALATRPVLLAVYTMHALLGDYRRRTSTATQASIGALVGRSVRTVRRAERQLAELGFVVRERLKRGRRLTLNDCAAVASATPTAVASATADTRTPARPPYQIATISESAQRRARALELEAALSDADRARLEAAVERLARYDLMSSEAAASHRAAMRRELLLGRWV